VADANVLVAASVSEPLSPQAARWFADVETVHIPDLCDYEVAHAFLRKVRQRRVPATEARRAFEMYLGLPILHRHANPAFDASTFEVSLQNTLGANDLIYALLAQRLNLPLVTADAGLLANASGLCRCVDLRTL